MDSNYRASLKQLLIDLQRAQCWKHVNNFNPETGFIQFETSGFTLEVKVPLIGGRYPQDEAIRVIKQDVGLKQQQGKCIFSHVIFKFKCIFIKV